MDKDCYKTSFRRCPLFHRLSSTGEAAKGLFVRRNEETAFTTIALNSDHQLLVKPRSNVLIVWSY